MKLDCVDTCPGNKSSAMGLPTVIAMAMRDVFSG